MRIIGIDQLRKLFLSFLDEAKYEIYTEGEPEVNDILFGHDKNAQYHEKIYTEYGFYNEAIEQVPDIESELVTPGIFAYDGSEIINNQSYECYSELVAFEFLGFEKQRKMFRKLLERMATDIRGKTFTAYYDEERDILHYDDGVEEGTLLTFIISTDMPELSDTIQQSGYDRFSAYINMDITVIKDIVISDSDSFVIDGEIFPLSVAKISRQKNIKICNVRTKETESYAESQSLTIAISGLLNGSSELCKKLKRGILDPNYLNESYVVSYGGYTYKMLLTNGEIEVKPSDIINVTAAFTTIKEV